MRLVDRDPPPITTATLALLHESEKRTSLCPSMPCEDRVPSDLYLLISLSAQGADVVALVLLGRSQAEGCGDDSSSSSSSMVTQFCVL